MSETNFVDKLIDKIYVDKTFLKLGLYETQCIVKLCVLETARYINNDSIKKTGGSLIICQDLINQCEVNHAK